MHVLLVVQLAPLLILVQPALQDMLLLQEHVYPVQQIVQLAQMHQLVLHVVQDML